MTLDGDRFAAEVRADEWRAVRLGVRGVPFIAIDGRFGISGAQDAEVILKGLRQAWDSRVAAGTSGVGADSGR